MIILGIDPGLQVCGYAVIEADRGREKIIEAGIFRTDASAALEVRLNQIAEDTRDLLEKFAPNIVAVEELYSHYKHPKTVVLMAHARGVILAQAGRASVTVKSFAATRIKKSLTGNGRADKRQMQEAIRSAFDLTELPEPADVADALAAALCCANAMTAPEIRV